MRYREDRADEDDPAGTQRGGGHGTGYGGGPLGDLFAPLDDDTAANTPTAAWSCGILAAPIFNSGLLAAPRPAEGASFDYAPPSPGVLRQARKIAAVCQAHGVTPFQAAMAFPGRARSPRRAGTGAELSAG
ncbi:hypothetical protein ACWCQS_05920 [Streptomyces sp. NPDC002076]